MSRRHRNYDYIHLNNRLSTPINEHLEIQELYVVGIAQTKVSAMKIDRDVCPVRHILDPVGDKWSILLLLSLKSNAARYSQINRRIPDISQRMLTLTLRRLERDGYVRRSMAGTVPPNITYELSPLGSELANHLSALNDWASQSLKQVSEARAAYDAAAKEAAE